MIHDKLYTPLTNDCGVCDGDDEVGTKEKKEEEEEEGEETGKEKVDGGAGREDEETPLE